MADADVHYHFRFVDNAVWECDVASVDTEQQALTDNLPDWTRLGFHQCSHCPLSTREHKYCPYAVALVEPARVTAMRPSHEPVTITVTSRSRTITADTTLQRAMGSLLGLVGPFSGCPVTRILRPMARFHLPLSSPDETLFRTFGTYLLGQFLRQRKGLEADWQMASLGQVYSDLRQLNQGMSGRLRASQDQDAGVNSFVILDLLAAEVSYALDEYEGDLDDSFREFLE
ncbi:hypothetical protein QPM17_12535 [Marinobacter sp. TBZ242]|uniref:Uncharacterized protein n=1 Tax=Marinobacter azerbaijanicus TaxID=3050455 RepID=A0ABT7ICT2_9GAMM|nr:hypothetical protein [Marinobacter sp. TBZ242]MDL0431964.1 hypothetical protein [Marinobacter sp. TBZ242]